MSDLEIFGEEDFEVVEVDENEETTEQAPDETPAEDEAPKVVKTKRVIRNPQPKLNAETLQGKRGLTALPSYFERVKFKGRGYEEEDLSVILKTYEYWCHRLFPKFPFDTCIQKIEQLGSKKKAVITHVKKIRYDMIGEEPVLDNFDDDDDVPNRAFDDLLPDPTPTQPRSQMEITEEQLERIRLNKERAERIRWEKMQQRELERLSQVGGSSFDDVRGQTDSEAPGVSQKEYETPSNDTFCDKKLQSRRRALVDSDEDEEMTEISQPTHEAPNDSLSQTNGRQRLRIVDSDEESEDDRTNEDLSANNQSNLRVETQNADISQPTDEAANDSFSQTNGRRRLRIDSDEESEDDRAVLSTNEAISSSNLRSVETHNTEISQQSSSTDLDQQNRRRFRALIDSDED